MPQVPTYDLKSTVISQPGNTFRDNTHATSDSFGGQMGAALGQVGKGMNEFASAMDAVAVLDDTNAAKDRENQYAKWSIDAQYGPDGILSKKGSAAIDAQKSFQEAAEAKRKELAEGLSPRAAKMYGDASQARLNGMSVGAASHVMNERKTWFAETSSARAQTFADSAIAGYQDPEAVTKNVAAGVLELRERGKMMGWQNDKQQAEEAAYVSGVHKSIAMRMADSDPIKAMEYIKANGAMLTGVDRANLEHALKDPAKRAMNTQDAERIIASVPRPGETPTAPQQEVSHVSVNGETLPATNGIKNNNPGNIKFMPDTFSAKQPGVVGPSKYTDQGTPQIQFADGQSGMNAMYGLLKKKYDDGLTTPRQIIMDANRGWTPGNEAAAANIAKMAGIGIDDDIRLSDPKAAAKFMRGLITQEHGKAGGHYSDEQINAAISGWQDRSANVAPAGSDPGMTRQSSVPPELSRSMRADARGNYNYMDVAKSLVGAHEERDTQAIASFIKRYAGTDIDPRSTAWCAAFVNAVLGSNGVAGTGKLNARSFLSFGTAVDQPREGDVVVFSRGDPNGWQGHVGFFAGYDEQGNIRVLGGNQGNSVSVSTYSKDQLLGFRRPPTAGSDFQMPNQTLGGLAHIEQELAKVDPARRNEVRAAIQSQMEFRIKYMTMQREEVQRSAEQWLIANPGMSPDRLPIAAQQALGTSGMTTLHNYHSARVTRGQPQTDDTLLQALREQYADDPIGYGQIDLFRYRDRLNDSDWKQVNEWRQTARTDQRKAKEEGLALTSAYSQAKTQLESIGLSADGKKGAEKEKVEKEIARFQSALTDEMVAFKEANNNRQPTQVDIQKMISRLIMPIVTKQDRSAFNPLGWFGSSQSETKGFAYQARTRPDGSTVEAKPVYEEIPTVLRTSISRQLETELGRKPSKEEIIRRYGAFQSR